jgi:catechol 2,3-dioxygenase-like lactoylglutathione lyase family enzyme
MHIDRIDHVVLTVGDIEATCVFYQRVLGMKVLSFEGGRTALAFGNQKFNLHQAGKEFEPKADRPTPGSADFCLITATPIPGSTSQVVQRAHSRRPGSAHRRHRADSLRLFPRPRSQPHRSIQRSVNAVNRAAQR